MATFVISREDPAQPEIIQLLSNGEAHSAKLYPAESRHSLPLDALRALNVCFLVGRTSSGRAVATGALITRPEWAEIKRIWIEEDARRAGLARLMVEALIAEAQKSGASQIRLEVGAASIAALTLYEREGFRRRAPFAPYKPDPLSVFMERDI